jgi:IS1 family transposase
MYNNNNNSWITIGIKTSCIQKREVYIASRNSNTVIQLQKKVSKLNVKYWQGDYKLYYDYQVKRKASNAAIESLNIDVRIISNEQHIVHNFNNYFLSTTDNINISNNKTRTQNKYNPNSDNYNIPLQSMSQIYVC